MYIVLTFLYLQVDLGRRERTIRHATLSGANSYTGEPRTRHGTLSSEHRQETVASSKVEDDDSGVDPEEGSDEVSLACPVSGVMVDLFHFLFLWSVWGSCSHIT